MEDILQMIPKIQNINETKCSALWVQTNFRKWSL